MKSVIHIAVQIELGRAHGRALLEGFSSVAARHSEWRPKLVSAESLLKKSVLDTFDAFVVRIMDDRLAALLRATGKPVIDLYGRSSRSFDAAHFQVVNIDDRQVVQAAVKCFLEHDFTNLGYCGFPGLRFSDERGRLFVRSLAEQGFSVNVYSGNTGITDSFFRHEKVASVPDLKSLKKWLKSFRGRSAAVFCCNDLRALQVSLAAEALGLSIPSDLALLGVDNDTAICTFSTPPLSSIDTDSEAIGRLAANKLAKMLDPELDLDFDLNLNLHVVERASTDFYPSSVPWLSEAIVFIQHHLADGVNANEVFRHLKFSHTYVEKVFRREFGRSVGEEIQARRLALARRLLKEKRYTSARIAAMTGFSSPQYFCRAFKAAIGHTPAGYREN